MHKPASPISPSWRPFADKVIQRLMASEPDPSGEHWLDDFDPVGADGTPNRPDFDDWMRAKDFPHLPHDLADELRTIGADAEATLITGESQPAAPLPAVELSLAIRLAALFGSAKALLPLLQNGAITFITGLDGPEIKVAEQVLRHGLLPAGLKISESPDTLSTTTELLLLYPDTTDKDHLFLSGLRQSPFGYLGAHSKSSLLETVTDIFQVCIQIFSRTHKP